MTIVALRLQHTPAQQTLLDHLPYFLPMDSLSKQSAQSQRGQHEGEREPGSTAPANACQADLCALGGFVFGILALQSEAGQEWLEKLSVHLHGCQKTVMEMNTGKCNSLAEQLAGVFGLLGRTGGSIHAE
jgi:hypothetical protein